MKYGKKRLIIKTTYEKRRDPACLTTVRLCIHMCSHPGHQQMMFNLIKSFEHQQKKSSTDYISNK
jgi:hypothetical protein